MITNQEPNLVRSTLFQPANVNSNKKEIGPGPVLKTTSQTLGNTNMQARNRGRKPKKSANSPYYNRHI